MAKELITLAIDAYHGRTGEFSTNDTNEALRQELIKIVGTDKPGYKEMRRHGAEVFEILEVALDKLIVEGLENQFDSFVETRNLALGDTNRFTVSDPKLFKIATISDGNGVLRRDRLDKGSFTVETHTAGVGIYEEFQRFLAGRIDWVDMVNRVARSYNQQIKNEVMDAVMGSYTKLGTTYNVTNSGSFDGDKMINLVAHVQAATGSEAQIWGTKAALAKIAPTQISDRMKDELNAKGYFGVFNGTALFEIPQAHKVGTDEFAIKDDTLLVLPTGGDRLVKLVLEGEAIIMEQAGGTAPDMQLEYNFIKKHGIAVIASKKYGMYRII